MDYEYLTDHETVRAEFLRHFTVPYGAFCHENEKWLASLPTRFRRGYTQDYFARLPYSDRLTSAFENLSFDAALEQLRRLPEVIFLTNGPESVMRDHAVFGTEQAWAARGKGAELADAIRGDWFRQYALWDQGMYDPEPLFGAEVYVFTADLRHALIFTHETDETELPETRVCLCYADK